MVEASPQMRDVEFAFDIGHSSIGWAVLGSHGEEPEILGCGSVVFQKDDCLASSRRAFRRQRRHIRSTRQRIARLEKFLVHCGIFTREQLAEKHVAGGGHASPWLLAARVLASNGAERLEWPAFWDVLRWYAHNRGYDSLAHLAGQAVDELSETELAQQKEDTEREQKAIELMQRHGKQTMAETVFAVLCKPHGVVDPLAVNPSRLPFLQTYFKGEKCAFSRKTVREEVERILRAHVDHLKGCDARFIRLMLTPALSKEDRAELAAAGIRLPKRYARGLLFGKLALRFDNRIIATCPITGTKVPGRRQPEFLEYRWAEKLNDLRTGAPIPAGEEAQFPSYKPGDLRALSANERRALDARVRALGFLHIEADKPDKTTGSIKRGRNELRDLVEEITGSDRHNLETMLLVPNIKEAFRLVPIRSGREPFRLVWGAFGAPHDVMGKDGDSRYVDDPLRHRFLAQLLRGKALTPTEVCRQLEGLGRVETSESIRAAVRAAATGRGKFKPERFDSLMSEEFSVERLKGRARFSTEMLIRAVQQTFHPTAPRDPTAIGGCLEQTREVQDRQLVTGLDHKTNNHLVRHRLLILRRLFDELRRQFPGNLLRTTIEVARELKEMSGMTAKQKAKELAGKINQHGAAADAAAKAMQTIVESGGKPKPITASLIRKARVWLDLNRHDIYRDQVIDFVTVIHGGLEIDHVIPRTQRLSDALEALVLTTPAINREKKDRTALQFVVDMNRPANAAKKAQLGIVTEAKFRELVEKLPTKGHRDDARRCERRKKFLLTEKWEAKDFKPGDLTKTSFLAKLGKQQIESVFADLPPEERPPVVTLPGAVTKAFRDRTWNLLPLMSAANAEVLTKLAEKERAKIEGRDYNLKKELRSVTSLHHAVDAAALALIVRMLIPQRETGVHDTLARCIVKERLGEADLAGFWNYVKSRSLPKFFRMAPGNQLVLEDLPQKFKDQLRECLAENLVVQHLPADRSGLATEENSRRFLRMEGGRAVLRQRVRDEKTGKLRVKITDEEPSRCLGLHPTSEGSKLQRQKAVRVITENFAIAILDHAADTAQRFVVVPWHRVHRRIEDLAKENGGHQPRLLRNGQLIRIQNHKDASRNRVWRIRSVKQTLKLDLSHPDLPEMKDSGFGVWREVALPSVGAQQIIVLRRSLSGIASR